jgi:DNA repair protein RecO (recombination protein O)
LADKLHKTKGIVLRSVKYGETSLIVSIYTEVFGLQSYLINGVRTAGRKNSGRSMFFQPAAILDLVVYYNEFKQLNRINEYKWARLNENIFTDVVKNGVALFMVELLSKCLKQPETNSDLYHFVEDAFFHLNYCNDKVLANYPLFFAAHLSSFFGLNPQNKNNRILESENLLFDMQEGFFTDVLPNHGYYLERKFASVLAQILLVRQPDELEEIQSNAAARYKILEGLETYYMLHIQDFTKMKTLPVLREILR